jgi:hypothetical protein
MRVLVVRHAWIAHAGLTVMTAAGTQTRRGGKAQNRSKVSPAPHATQLSTRAEWFRADGVSVSQVRHTRISSHHTFHFVGTIPAEYFRQLGIRSQHSAETPDFLIGDQTFDGRQMIIDSGYCFHAEDTLVQ